ncbi:MAG TPA: tRNA lysidine(34) synthetase TilS [Bacteroidales bacterium]|nr:tRNA lysidine(34) synthetase TilS [Bacteroidales bacterium]
MVHQQLQSLVLQTIRNHALFSIATDTLLVGVSGGVDSMVLLHILQALECKVHVAHCNFSLRGAESDADEHLVVSYAQSNNIPYSVTRFNTREYAQQTHMSIEMAARELRYDWFSELCVEHSCDYIAIAHNENDSVETFFIQLLRTTGIKGLRGIPITNGRIVRPLLNCTRSSIEAYAHANNITYRTDSSNLENEYVRNKIRNIVLPQLVSIHPQAHNNIVTSMHHVSQAYDVYADTIAQELARIVTYTGTGCMVNEHVLLAHKHKQALAFELFRSYGFTPNSIEQILQSFGTQSGKIFESPQYTAVHDRDTLYILPKIIEQAFQIEVLLQSYTISTPYAKFRCSLHNSTEITLTKHPHWAYIDAAKLSNTLVLRTWKAGDSFVPFGMKGNKKVSDYLIDAKIPVHIKQHVLVLESNGIIVWLVGFTIHNSYAITSHTKRVFCIEMQQLNDEV